ncbi:MAG: translation initiation factor [Myxococcales bacterium]|nr:translation initiation factor [Myxococcales bacterium]
MRVYEIAKEVGIANKDLIAKIRALGLEVNNHMSSLDADDVARIRRSLEKEKASVAAPQQTQRLGTGAVLRRRSSGDKAADSAEEPQAKPERAVAPSRVAAEPPRPVAQPPVVRRREPVAPVAAAPPVAEAAPTPAPQPVRVTPPPAEPTPVAKPEPAPVVQARPAPVRAPEPAASAPEPPAPVKRESSPRIVVEAKPQPVETPAPAVVTPPVAPKSRVILAGPQVVARGSSPSGEPSRTPEPSQPLPPRAAPVRPTSQPSSQSTSNGGGTQQHATQASEAAPPAPMPTGRGPKTVVDMTNTGTARSRFEMELERARARTVTRDDRPRGDTGKLEPVRADGGENGETQTAEGQPARDPSRPAVGTVIALPPRIKITERAPAVGHKPSGPQPVNPIRGRFAQQSQQRTPRGPSGEFGKKKLPLGKKGKQTTLTTPAEHKRVIRIEDTIAIQDLARNMGIKAPEVLKKLWGMGMTGVNINASIDFETAQILAAEFAYEVQNVAFKEEEAFSPKLDEADSLIQRAPVVTVMGHVDHGKTSLLDAIRKTRVAAGESGGITQHVAAYKVKAPGHGDIVFLDTPGHEAFTEMRARGAQATDIVVLVVAANDGVMPQTIEALNHAKDAKVTIIVAVNKVDLPDATPDRVRQQLADHQLIAEEWGGDTIYVNVSALKGEGIDKLLESIAVSAEVLELKANPNKPASGLVIEARLDRNRGPMATILIQEGTLRVGDMLVAGRVFGKVRAMLDDRGNSLEEAGPSTPIEVLGLDGVPEAGDQVNAAEDDKVAKQVVEHRRQQFRRRELASTGRVSLESLMAKISEGIDTKELKIVLKADVQGSAEALKAALVKLSTEKVKVNVIGAAVGGITESDVNLAKAGNAIIIGFHVRPAGKSSKLAEQEGVDIRLYDIIYDALDEVKSAMAGLLAPIKREIPMGKLQVRETFSIPKMGTVAGCMVTEGKINRKAHLRIIRDAVQIYEGKVGSLRRFKDDVSEVANGYECGVMVAGWNEIKQNDVIEAYEVVEEAAKL